MSLTLAHPLVPRLGGWGSHPAGVAFADTSGLLALLNKKDENHARAERAFATLVDGALHEAGLDLLLGRRKRQLRLVDAVSFVTMRQRAVAEAFAFDPQFEQEGFSLVS